MFKYAKKSQEHRPTLASSRPCNLQQITTPQALKLHIRKKKEQITKCLNYNRQKEHNKDLVVPILVFLGQPSS